MFTEKRILYHMSGWLIWYLLFKIWIIDKYCLFKKLKSSTRKLSREFIIKEFVLVKVLSLERVRCVWKLYNILYFFYFAIILFL